MAKFKKTERLLKPPSARGKPRNYYTNFLRYENCCKNLAHYLYL